MDEEEETSVENAEGKGNEEATAGTEQEDGGASEKESKEELGRFFHGCFQSWDLSSRFEY